MTSYSQRYRESWGKTVQFTCFKSSQHQNLISWFMNSAQLTSNQWTILSRSICEIQKRNHTTGHLQNASKHNFLSTLLGLTHSPAAGVSHRPPSLLWRGQVAPFTLLPRPMRALQAGVCRCCYPDPTNAGAGEKAPCPQAPWGGGPACCPTLPSADGHLNISSSLITSAEYY